MIEYKRLPKYQDFSIKRYRQLVLGEINYSDCIWNVDEIVRIFFRIGLAGLALERIFSGVKLNQTANSEVRE